MINLLIVGKLKYNRYIIIVNYAKNKNLYKEGEKIDETWISASHRLRWSVQPADS